LTLRDMFLLNGVIISNYGSKLLNKLNWCSSISGFDAKDMGEGVGLLLDEHFIFLRES
jgi:hypothetical protein